MRSDPTGFTGGKELVKRDRLVKGEDPGGTDHAYGVFLELWEEGRSADPKRYWAICIMDDYREHIGSGIHMRITDDEAGYLQRQFTEADDA